MRVGIVGSRGYPDLSQIERFVDALVRKYPDCWIVSGGARDADETAEEAGRVRMMHVRSFRPVQRRRHYEIVLFETGRRPETVRGTDNRPLSFKTFRDAALHRNGLIAGEINQLAAFHYQNSSGTMDTILKARARGIPAHVYHPTN